MVYAYPHRIDHSRTETAWVIVRHAWTENVVQTLDYYPYGSTRISSATSTNEQRKYIGQFADQSGLDYFNARYYSSDQGQFISEDPMFWSTQNLSDPQSFNTYSYAADNPITKEDPSGKYVVIDARALQGPFNLFGTHTAFDVVPQNPSLIDYTALGIPAGTTEFTIGFYAGSNGYLVTSVAYAGGSTNPSVWSQAMADYNKTGLKAAYPFSGLSAQDEAQAINAMSRATNNYNGTVKYPSPMSNIFGTGINSNSAVNTLSTMAGLSRQYQSLSYPWYTFTNGSNLSLPSSSFNSQGQAQIQRGLQIAALQLQVAQLQLQVMQLQTGNDSTENY
jgi:RHS repeat-associated protein